MRSQCRVGEAVVKALPDALQVADRWHLFENASAAFLGAMHKSMRLVRTAIGATTIKPALLTSAEKIRSEDYLRREETNSAIMALAKDGVPMKQIVCRFGCEPAGRIDPFPAFKADPRSSIP